MTPAEKPNENAKNFVLVVLAKKAMALPIPVDNPANKVRKKANMIGLLNIVSVKT